MCRRKVEQTPEETFIEKGYIKVQKEMNLLHIISSLQKLKVAVGILLEGQTSKIKEIKRKFYKGRQIEIIEEDNSQKLNSFTKSANQDDFFTFFDETHDFTLIKKKRTEEGVKTIKDAFNLLV